MARPSLIKVLVLSLLAPVAAGGCLVAESPQYGAPRRTAALINDLRVDPPPTELLIVERGLGAEPFTIPVRSEDAGEELVTVFYVDYLPGLPRNHIQDESHPPGTFDRERPLTTNVDLSARAPDGCHQLTLVVLHESSYDDMLDKPREFTDADQSSVTWWMNVNAPDPYTLVDCPSRSTMQPETMQ